MDQNNKFQPRKESFQTPPKEGIAKKVGDAVERLGDKIGANKVGKFVHDAGDKIEHMSDKNKV